MSEMVERVARAIYQSKLLQPARADDPWDGPSSATKVFCRDAARAAIEAMREPTTSMMEAGWKASRGEWDEVGETWEAMVDAAVAPPVEAKSEVAG